LFSLVELEAIADRTISFSSQLWLICFWITEQSLKKEKDTITEEEGSLSTCSPNALACGTIRPGCTTSSSSS
jgi:hypothetical protein